MAKHLVKKVNTVKSVKKAAIKKPTKVVKPAKKPTPKPASTIIQKKPADLKSPNKIAASTSPVKSTSKIGVKKPAATDKKTAKPAMKTAKQTVSSSHPKISSEDYMNEEYMNSGQQSHFRELLLIWKKQLVDEMEHTVHHMQEEAANFPDPIDRAAQEEEFSLDLRAGDRKRKLVTKINEALKRLDNHEYGYCEACGVEIGVQRLNARPTATLCIDCKTIDEIREKHFS